MYASYIIEADSSEDAEREAVEQAGMGFSPNSDYFGVEVDTVEEAD